MSEAKRTFKVHRFRHEAMTTVFEVFIAGKKESYSRQAARAAFDEVDRIERLFNRFDPSSEISRIGRLRPGERMMVGVETVECLALAARIQAETAGAFDVNYRALLAGRVRHRTGSKEGQSPPGGTVPIKTPNLLNVIGVRMIPGGFEVERLRPTSRRKPPALDLDLGAVGKGYAVDRAIEVLADWSVTNALVHAGTSTALGIGPGPRPGKPGWPVGAGAPWVEAAEARLRGRALSGSGTAVKGEHIIDPRTGRPARGHLAAWASHPSAAVSDALATAFLVMTTGEVARYCRTRPEVRALVINSRKKCRIFNANVLAKL